MRAEVRDGERGGVRHRLRGQVYHRSGKRHGFVCRIIPQIPYQEIFVIHNYNQTALWNMLKFWYVIEFYQLYNISKFHSISFCGLINIMGQNSRYGSCWYDTTPHLVNYNDTAMRPSKSFENKFHGPIFKSPSLHICIMYLYINISVLSLTLFCHCLSFSFSLSLTIYVYTYVLCI